MLKVLKDLSGKISEVGDLEVAKDLTEIFETLTSRAATLSRKYWSLVKTLAATELERDTVIQNKAFSCGICDEAYETYEGFKFHLGTEEHKDEVMCEEDK